MWATQSSQARSVEADISLRQMPNRVDRPERTGGSAKRFGVRCADKPIDSAGTGRFLGAMVRTVQNGGA